MIDFLVARDDLRSCQFVESADPTLEPAQALLRVDRFALTANNITYARLGDRLGYWRFFPAPDGWGRIPAWGFAEVIASRHDALEPGQRFYGYYPMSTHLVVAPAATSRGSFVDATPHRAALPALYNRYLPSAPGTDARAEAEQALLRPLFGTSFLLADFLADAGYFGATSVVITSASSKTAIGCALLLHARGDCRVVGLTSRARIDFVERVGGYHQVMAYDDLTALPADAPAVFIDLAGDAALSRAIHVQFGDRLRYSCIVGSTHAPAGGAVREPLPGPTPTLFFAPAHAERRAREWGAAGLQDRMAAAWQQLTAAIGWLRFREERGAEAVERAYRAVLEGRSAPDEGHILSL